MGKPVCVSPGWRLFVLILAVLLIAGCPKDYYQQGQTAYEKEDYGQALAIWGPLAEQGNSEAQFNLGFMYATGQGVSQDKEIAVNWYRKAAELGHAKAQYNLGLALLKGEGVGVDLDGAVKWLQKSVNQGYVPAQLALGSLYGQGKGVAAGLCPGRSAVSYGGRARAPGGPV
jgi:TPR repeat protein